MTRTFPEARPSNSQKQTSWAPPCECTELPYAITLLVDTAIVQKEEFFVECTKPPVFRKAKPGTHAQSIISLMKIRNPNPFPIGNKFGFFMYGGA